MQLGPDAWHGGCCIVHLWRWCTPRPPLHPIMPAVLLPPLVAVMAPPQLLHHPPSYTAAVPSPLSLICSTLVAVPQLTPSPSPSLSPPQVASVSGTTYQAALTVDCAAVNKLRLAALATVRVPLGGKGVQVRCAHHLCCRMNRMAGSLCLCLI